MVKLLDGQQDHFDKVRNNLKKYGSCLDTSALGSGKTYVAAMLSKGYANTLIVSTGVVLKKWKQIKKENPDIKSEYIYSSFLKGGENLKKLYKNYMDQYYRDTQKKARKFLIVLDEVHKYRNACKSTNEFIRTLVNIDKECYDILCISSTPMDKPYTQLEQITTLLGVTRWRSMSVGSPTRCDYLVSFLEFVIKHESHEHDTLFENLEFQTLKTRYDNMDPAERHKNFKYQIDIMSYDMIHDFINRHLTVDCALLNKSVVNTQVLMKRLSCRESNTVMENTNMGHFHGEGSIYSFFGTEFMLEMLKYREYRQDILRDIRDNPDRKFIIMLKYTATITLLDMYLSTQCSETVMTITAQTSQNKQANILRSFQEPNINTRILVCCISRTSTGIDLDDKCGNFPRTMYLFKGMKSIDCEQARSRIKRLDTKSDSILKIPLVGHDGTHGNIQEERFIE